MSITDMDLTRAALQMRVRTEGRATKVNEVSLAAFPESGETVSLTPEGDSWEMARSGLVPFKAVDALETMAALAKERDLALECANDSQRAMSYYRQDIALLCAEIIRLHDLLGRAGVPFVDPGVQPGPKPMPALALRDHPMNIGLRVP